MKYRVALEISHPEGNEHRTFRLKERERLFVGRREGDVILPDRRVSRKHLGMAVVKGRLVVADLNSSFGTRLEGKPIRQIQLREGETLTLGNSSIRLRKVGRGFGWSVPRISLPLPKRLGLPGLPSDRKRGRRHVAGAMLGLMLVAGVLGWMAAVGPSEKAAEKKPRFYYSAGVAYRY